MSCAPVVLPEVWWIKKTRVFGMVHRAVIHFWGVIFMVRAFLVVIVIVAPSLALSVGIIKYFELDLGAISPLGIFIMLTYTPLLVRSDILDKMLGPS
jgi:hypothetical protein